MKRGHDRTQLTESANAGDGPLGPQPVVPRLRLGRASKDPAGREMALAASRRRRGGSSPPSGMTLALALYLRDVRLRRGISQRTLVKAITGLSQGRLSELEAGENLTVDTLIRWAAALDHEVVVRPIGAAAPQ